MWAKISNAMKRPVTPSMGLDEEDAPNVMGGVYEQHPNLSVFHEPSQQPSGELPFPSPRDPPSPIMGRKNLLKKASAPAFESSPAKLQLAIPKKVKSSLRIKTHASGSDLSLPRASVDSENKPTPSTPNGEGVFSSLRSILRQPNTPATGQSVRFFSRDAYKMFTPEATEGSSSHEDVCFSAHVSGNGLARSTPARMTAQELFAEPFDVSQPTIPAAAPLLDSAVEVEDDDIRSTVLKESIIAPVLEPPAEIIEPAKASPDGKSSSPAFGQRIFHARNPSTASRPETPQLDRSLDTAETSERDEGEAAADAPASHPSHDRSHSFSFGQTIFQSAAANTASISRSRSRAFSDSVYRMMRPEADINDETDAVVAFVSPEQKEREKERDPFGMNATTYYTPGAGVPPTPPQHTHTRTASQEEGVIASLRVQLALQAENAKLLEQELASCNEVAAMLGQRLEASEGECDRRRTAVRSWRKRVAELERCVMVLQEEVERSREESVDRSVMDEASGEALRLLQRRIGALERDKTQGEDELKKARLELQRRDQTEAELQAGIKAAKDEMERLGQQENTSMSLDESFRAGAWEEERAELLAANEALRGQHTALENQLAEARQETSQKDAELGVLKAELEAQWKHTENAGDKVQQLENERDELKAEVDALNQRISNMELDWTDAENKRAEVEAEIEEAWAAKEEVERDRNELEDQLRAEQEHADHLTRSLQEREDRVSSLERDAQYTQDKIAKLEKDIRQRDAEATELMQRMAAREAETEAAQEEVTRMKRDHARIVNEQSRKLQEVVAREVEARAGLEEIVRAKAETDVSAGSLREKINALTEETERLRRQVHTLQQESADKEVRLTNFVKQRTQDKEDIKGLNIALDSKQQELELLKRRMGVRGTAGNTPASAAKVPPHRRESSIFGTPAVGSSRPPSVLSDTGSVKSSKNVDTPTTITKAALARTTRTNAPSAPGHVAKRSSEGGMGPPPGRTSGSISATPTRIPSGSRASPPSSMRPATSTLSRRSSASVTEPSRLRKTISGRDTLSSVGSASESDDKEKENTAPVDKTPGRIGAIPVPA